MVKILCQSDKRLQRKEIKLAWTDGHTDGHTDGQRENIIPPATSSAEANKHFYHLLGGPKAT